MTTSGDARHLGANAVPVEQWRRAALFRLSQEAPELHQAVLTGRMSLRDAEDRLNGKPADQPWCPHYDVPPEWLFCQYCDGAHDDDR